jgi:hypothetical protein
MCLISTEIEKVSKTKILVAPNSNSTRQLVVYSNYVNNVSESNAMVLPVPNPQTVKFIDLTGYKNLFEDCASCFYSPYGLKSSTLNYSTNSYNTRDDKPLEVFNVGSYKVSLAMNLEQISRVDPRVFVLSPGLKQTLEMFYYQPYWGFIICKLNSGPETYHPLAYSHQIIDSKIYIPTRHYHQEVKWSDVNTWALGLHIDPKQNPINANSWNETNIDSSPMFRGEQFGLTAPEANGWVNLNKDSVFGKGLTGSDPFGTNSIAKMSSKYDNLKKLNDSNYRNKQNPQIQNNSSNYYKNVADDWSHSIYLLNINPYINEQIKQMNSSREIWDKQSLFDPDKINFDFGYCNNFTKLQIDGTHPNIDLVIPVQAS